MKLAGIFCICISVISGGMFYTLRCRQREALYGELASFFGCLSLTAVSLGGELSLLLRRCAGTASGRFALPQTLLQLYAQTGDLCAAWFQALEQTGASRLLPENEAAFLAFFGGACAVPSLSVFTETCRQYEAHFTALKTAAEAKRQREEKLGVSITLLTAALLFIMLV